MRRLFLALHEIYRNYVDLFGLVKCISPAVKWSFWTLKCNLPMLRCISPALCVFLTLNRISPVLKWDFWSFKCNLPMWRCNSPALNVFFSLNCISLVLKSVFLRWNACLQHSKCVFSPLKCNSPVLKCTFPVLRWKIWHHTNDLTLLHHKKPPFPPLRKLEGNKLEWVNYSSLRWKRSFLLMPNTKRRPIWPYFAPHTKQGKYYNVTL